MHLKHVSIILHPKFILGLCYVRKIDEVKGISPKNLHLQLHLVAYPEITSFPNVHMFSFQWFVLFKHLHTMYVLNFVFKKTNWLSYIYGYYGY